METVKMGRHVLPVVPQKHARLRHQLSAGDFQALMSKDYAREAYRVLGILIPELVAQVPEWEFEGYASEEAWKAGDYVEALDNSPTTAEIIDAFEKAFIVSGAGRLGKIVDLIQSGQRAMERQASGTSTPVLPDSPGENGGSPTPNTGTSPPTPTASVESPGPDFSS